MLRFVDKPSVINIFRLETATGSDRRSKLLGYIHKKKLEITDALRQELNEEELVEVERIVNIYITKDAIERDLYLKRLPETLRSLVNFVNSEEADELEKRILVQALSDAMRQIRRVVLA